MWLLTIIIHMKKHLSNTEFTTVLGQSLRLHWQGKSLDLLYLVLIQQQSSSTQSVHREAMDVGKDL
jgi:hypothetical protein